MGSKLLYSVFVHGADLGGNLSVVPELDSSRFLSFQMYVLYNYNE